MAPEPRTHVTSPPCWRIDTEPRKVDGKVQHITPRWFYTEGELAAFWSTICRIEASAGRPLAGAVVTAPDGSTYRIDAQGVRETTEARP